MNKREPLMTDAYFSDAITYMQATLADRTAKLEGGNASSIKKPYVLARANFRDRCELLIARYSAGEPVAALAGEVEPIVAAWEKALATPGSQPNDLTYLDDYVRSLWLLSLGLIFKVDDTVWKRLLACMGGEGQDTLVERLASRRTAGRPQARSLLHPEPYALLDQAAALVSPDHMARFLKAWYPGLREVGWHDSHKGPDGGGFFGYWAIEAAGVAVAFGMDDAPFRDMPFYPVDLADFGRSGASA